MKHTIRENIHSPYSLHDMTVTEFSVDGDDMLLRTHSGILKTVPVCSQVKGHLKFRDLGCYGYEIPEEYCDIPKYNF